MTTPAERAPINLATLEALSKAAIGARYALYRTQRDDLFRALSPDVVQRLVDCLRDAACLREGDYADWLVEHGIIDSASETKP